VKRAKINQRYLLFNLKIRKGGVILTRIMMFHHTAKALPMEMIRRCKVEIATSWVIRKE
jgi:hypothetical protein